MLVQPIANPFLYADSSVRSLNRARIVALQGVPVEAGVLGKTGYDLLSAASLQQLISAAADRLCLDPAAPDLIRRFDACFDNPATLAHAVEIARGYGHRLGCLLLMLTWGEPANRAARPTWSEAHWTFWQAVRQVYLGGGLMAGHLGRYAVETAQAFLTAAGMTTLALERAPFGAYLPLVGLARAAPSSMTSSLLFDFGQTSVKCGCAHYHAGQLTRIDVWSDVPTVCKEVFPAQHSDEELRQHWQWMADIIAARWTAVPPGQRPLTAIGISLACYLFDGHPSPQDHGCYGSLQRLSPHLATFIADELAQRLGQAVQVTLLHDGAAAAAVYAGRNQAVVITLGSAMGNGFPPREGKLWRMASDFALIPGIKPKVAVGG
jgi:hypothetical protein